MALTTRRRAVTTIAAAFAGAVAVPSYARATERGGPPAPLRRAHAHNDYLHERPLHDALSHRFTSVEADVFLVDGELLVAHEPETLDPTRTLRSLYLDPLRERVRANGGAVYRGHHRPVQLLIDIKTDGAAAYLELHRQLRAHRSMLSTYSQGAVRHGAVTPVISGDRAARVPMEAQKVRHAFYDGRLEDLGGTAGASFIPLISSNWTTSFTWQESARSPPLSAPSCTASSAPPTGGADASGSGRPPTSPDPHATPSGPSCSTPASTTSTPTTSPAWSASWPRTTGSQPVRPTRQLHEQPLRSARLTAECRNSGAAEEVGDGHFYLTGPVSVATHRDLRAQRRTQDGARDRLRAARVLPRGHEHGPHDPGRDQLHGERGEQPPAVRAGASDQP